MLDLARVFSTFTLEREWMCIYVRRPGVFLILVERQKRKRRGCPFLRHSSCYTARFIGWGFSMLDEHTNKAMMETVKPFSFFLSFFLLSLLCY